MTHVRFDSNTKFISLGVDVAIRCGGCRRVRNMASEQLGAIFGQGTRVASVERRLRCSECGHKGAKLAPIPKLQ